MVCRFRKVCEKKRKKVCDSESPRLCKTYLEIAESIKEARFQKAGLKK